MAEVFHSVEATPSNFTFTDTNHTFTCDECHESITEPHDLYFYYGKEDECYCGYVKSSETRLPGDVNADGTVNMRDALALLKKLADWDVTINQSNSDVNGDGAVNMRDALTLLKYLADWDVVLK
ncbi:MAG: hypothetical protein IJ438_08760 [Clostridia bacterium]|nr:hypothetical protein [Clostridia bacterium]